MHVASREPPEGHASAPVVICIADSSDERARLAGLFDGAGVLVMAPDADSARSFLGNLRAPSPGEAPDESGRISVGGLALDLTSHEATWHGRLLELTQHELKVLGCLASSPGRLWTYQQLHNYAWGESYFAGPAAVQSVLKRLRAKLRQLDVPVRIHTVRGVGLRLARTSDLHLVR